jgi:hypothetical protein
MSTNIHQAKKMKIVFMHKQPTAQQTADIPDT